MGERDEQLDSDQRRVEPNTEFNSRLEDLLDRENDGEGLFLGLTRSDLVLGGVTFAAIFVLTLIGGIVYAAMNPGTIGAPEGVNGLLNRAQGQPEHPLKSAFGGTEEVTVLLAGIDERPPHRSDTVMLLNVSTEHPRAKLLSLPRDAYVHIPPVEDKWNGGYSKLAHSHAWGDMPTLVETVEEFTGVAPDRYMSIDFQGFVSAVEALGGVEMTVEKDMHYVDEAQDLRIDLDQGRQELDGREALHYARYRGDKLGDLGRMRRQQKLLKTFFHQALMPERISSLPSVLRELYRAVKTDMSLDELNALRQHFAGKADRRNIATRTLESEPMEREGLIYQQVKPAELEDAVQWLRDLEPPEPESEPAEKSGSSERSSGK